MKDLQETRDRLQEFYSERTDMNNAILKVKEEYARILNSIFQDFETILKEKYATVYIPVSRTENVELSDHMRKIRVHTTRHGSILIVDELDFEVYPSLLCLHFYKIVEEWNGYSVHLRGKCPDTRVSLYGKHFWDIVSRQEGK